MKKKVSDNRLTQIVIVLAILFIGSCNKSNPDKHDLIIFHAGSLSIPLKEISQAFEAENPGIKVKMEASGSRECARKIASLHRQCDIIASADYKVIANLLIPEHANFNIRFALNEMAIAYTDKSRMKDKITPENWHEIMLKNEVAFGRSDPDTDPCGYRTLMTFQLAEYHYKIEGLAQTLKEKTTHIRPKETDLLALLETGEIDYLFIYRSVAAQHKLNTLLLPDQINLKSQAYSEIYNKATVEVSGKKPGEIIVRKGEPMVYSVSILTDAPHPEAAQKWVELLLSDRGRAIMEANGQPTINPALADGMENMPRNLKLLCK